MCLLNGLWGIEVIQSFHVSILVLVDVPLESICNSYSTLDFLYVSILVLVDVPLEFCDGDVFEYVYHVSILVLVDVPLE